MAYVQAQYRSMSMQQDTMTAQDLRLSYAQRKGFIVQMQSAESFCLCRCASIDGDADRIVFFSPSASGFVLLDGDRIAVLAALLINELVSQLQDNGSVSVCPRTAVSPSYLYQDKFSTVSAARECHWQQSSHARRRTHSYPVGFQPQRIPLKAFAWQRPSTLALQIPAIGHIWHEHRDQQCFLHVGTTRSLSYLNVLNLLDF